MAMDPNNSDDEVWQDTRVRCCIQESRCRLCSFGLKEGDLIKISPRWSGILRLDEFLFHRGDIKINEAAILCCCCSDDCESGRIPVHCFHAECSVFARNILKIEDVSQNFLDGTRFGFAPPLWGGLERFRANRLSELLAEKLKKEYWPKSLPNEIWRMITDNFVRECAIVTAYEQTLSASLPPGNTINLSRDVYAEYTTFDGIRYLKTLRNPEDRKGHGELVLRGQEVGSIREVYVIDDHFGVRDLLFVSDKDRLDRILPSPSSLPSGTWVRRISTPLGIWNVGVECDGFRVRGAYNMDFGPRLEFDPQQNLRSRKWLSSQHTVFDLRKLKPNYLGFRQRSTSYQIFPQMESFDCNASRIIGYSAAVTDNGVVAIYSHYRDSDFSMYSEVNPLFPVRWIYMPIDQGEFVTEICRFVGSTMMRPRPYGLTFTTNHGRTTVFGGHFDLTEHRDLERIYDPPSRPSTIFFDKSHVINWLACENMKPTARREIPQSVIPITSVDLSPLGWYYSRCEMEGVTHIIPCHKNTRHPNQLVGLLLEYEDGHRERLGEWRFDWAAEPIRVLGHSGSLRLKEKVYDHLCDGQVCKVWDMEVVPARAPPSEEEDYDWYIDLPWHGTLEWWFDLSPLFCAHSHAEWLPSPDTEAETLDDEEEEKKEVPWQEWVDWDEVWPAWFNDKSMPLWYEPSENEFDEGSDVESD
ncbi:uncharacterized protein F4807DRAFT_467816 [Annulohypoxylon truncatum]|uniref:uncharacterized protein n=1 Tax=Annulohypoxylon truncatum TaxID=327061 RepID=UPI002007DB19|nr:uncharacterized protein F4807DRAFT_467816 [Annulohypoxylon truncatum]KAI1209198.1 hypothetical protein F4807DRAFT_467816 [Annulohypoxylon truncatum]